MDLDARLDQYEVTVVPSGVPALTLVWSEPDDVDDDGDAAAPGEPGGGLAILDDYRITRVPARAAS